VIPALIAAGTAASVWGNLSSAHASKEANLANAAASAEEARQQEAVGLYEQGQALDEMRATIAHNTALYGKAGVTMEGTPFTVQTKAMQRMLQDKAMIAYNRGRLAISSLKQSQIFTSQARAATTAGMFGVGTSLLGGARQYLRMNPSVPSSPSGWTVNGVKG